MRAKKTGGGGEAKIAKVLRRGDRDEAARRWAKTRSEAGGGQEQIGMSTDKSATE